MEEKKKASEAHMRATAKWEKENYDKVLVRFPKERKRLYVLPSKGKPDISIFRGRSRRM